MHSSLKPKILLIVALWSNLFLLQSLGLKSTFNPKPHHRISWTSIASQSSRSPSLQSSDSDGSHIREGTQTVASGETITTTSTSKPTALIPDDASTSASSLSIKIAGVYPAIQSWIDDPGSHKASDAVDAIQKTIPAVNDLVDSLGGRVSTGPPCDKKHMKRINSINLPGDLIDSVSCVSITFERIKSTIERSNFKREIDTGADVEGVISELNVLKSVVKPLDKRNKNDDSKNDDEEKTADESATTKINTETNDRGTYDSYVTAINTKNQARVVPVTKSISSKRSPTSTSIDVICSAECEACQSNTPSLKDSLRREFLDYYPQANISEAIAKRAITNPPADYKEYKDWLQEHIVNGDDAILVGANRAHGGLPSHVIVPLKDKAFSMGQMGLKSCSSIIVISRYAIYMSHLWDIPAFRTDTTGSDGKKKFEFVEANFRAGALDFTRNTISKPKFQGSDEYPNPSAKAIIVTPWRANEGGPMKHPDQVSRLSRMLKETLQLSENPLVVNYYSQRTTADPGAVDPRRKPFDYADGKMVLFYDPNNKDAPEGCDRERAVAVWVGLSKGENRDPNFITSWKKDPEPTGGPG